MRKYRILIAMLASCVALSIHAGGAAEEEPAGTTAPDGPLTLSFYMSFDRDAAVTMTNNNDKVIFQVLEERTGVHIDWIHPTGGSEQFNLMLASRDLPDMVWGNWRNMQGGPIPHVRSGLILQLNDLIEQHAPNYSRVLEENPDTMRQLKVANGVIVTFANLRPDIRTCATEGFQIRKDWLDRVGLGIPETIDDWYTVLKAFKEQDANGNGDPDDEIPFISRGADRVAWGIKCFSGPFDINVPMRFYPGPDGDLVYTYTDERLREYLETMRQWIAEGLIDPDYITTDRDAFDAKVTGNIAGAWEGQIGNKMFEYIELMTPEVPGFELVGAPWPRGEHQVEPYVIPNGYVAKVLSGVAISGQNEHVEESIEWLDYGYGREGHILFNYGIEGESFDYVGDTPVIKDKFFQHPEGLSASQAFAPYYVGFSYPYIHDIEQINQFRPYKAQKEAMRIWTTNVDTSLIFPWLAGFIPSAAEAQEFFDIYGEVNTYTSEMFNKYLLGVESLDSFDEFVETQRRMNIDRAVEIWQLAYERYLSGE